MVSSLVGFLFSLLMIVGQQNSAETIHKPASTESRKETCCEILYSEGTKNLEIVPGVSVGKVKIHDSLSAVIAKLNECDRYIIDSIPEPGYYEAELKILDRNQNVFTGGNGTRAFVKNGEIFQIVADSYLYSDETLTINSELADVKEKYPSGELFLLKGSANINRRNSKDSKFWIVKSKGIAFEIYPSKHGTQRVIAIYVFSPNTEFFPLGNLNSPQFLRLIKLR